jgi:hypothetical protein
MLLLKIMQQETNENIKKISLKGERTELLIKDKSNDQNSI